MQDATEVVAKQSMSKAHAIKEFYEPSKEGFYDIAERIFVFLWYCNSLSRVTGKALESEVMSKEYSCVFNRGEERSLEFYDKWEGHQQKSDAHVYILPPLR